MKQTRIVASVLALAFLANNIVLAFETDQYNLPDEPLADSGAEISEFIFKNLRDSIAELNIQIARSAACIESTLNGCDPVEKERQKLARLRSDSAPAEALFRRIGDGNLFRTKFGRWLYSHTFRSSPASYKAPIGDSIFLINPLNQTTLSPTYRLYGVELGGDKLEHLLQQGYKYYTIYVDERAKGRSEADAAAKAISWGRRTERTYFGLLSSGVYSNADLFANYAGLKFYMLLTQKPFGGPDVAPILHLEGGRWAFRRVVDPGSFLKPFITKHHNEALNAASYRLTLYGSVRRQVKRHACEKWHRAFPKMTRGSVDLETDSLKTWNGEDYGYTPRSRTLTIGGACFEKE